jgi:DNA repair exonuclease SbcCD ATPase subunit
MRYIHFKRIRIINFLSIGKKPVEVSFKPGLNIITGKNYDKADRANGVGKSTIADAVHFALYGSTIRDLKKENIVNDQAPEELCEVELEFTYQQDAQVNECKIVRTLNPTKCYFFVNGQDVTRSGVPQTTEYITSIIKTSSEVFQNSVIMTINNTVPFMAQKKVEKRKFIEGILGLEVFSNMLLLARSDFNDAKRTVDIELTKQQEVERSLVDANKQKSTYEENKSKRLAVLHERQKNNEQELSILNDKVSKFEPVDQEAEKKIKDAIELLKTADKAKETKKQSIQKLITEAETQIRIANDRLKKLKKNDSKCPHCGKDLCEEANVQYEKDKKELQTLVFKFEEELKTERPRLQSINEEIEKLDAKIPELERKLSNFNVQRKELENINNRIKQIENWQSQLVVDISHLEKESNDFQATIDSILTRQKEITNNITALQERLDIIESAKYITSEEGVKSFIVKKILEVLNVRLAHYLRRLESNSIVTFNEFFEEYITNERGKECSYFNFSGAERKAIDLAMLFTFQDIRRAQADVWLNLSMFDELFDSSLDEKGIELVLDILKERVDNYNESIYIISHRKESKKYCIGGEIVYLEKKNGITTRTTTYDLS